MLFAIQWRFRLEIREDGFHMYTLLVIVLFHLTLGGLIGLVLRRRAVIALVSTSIVAIVMPLTVEIASGRLPLNNLAIDLQWAAGPILYLCWLPSIWGCYVAGWLATRRMNRSVKPTGVSLGPH